MGLFQQQKPATALSIVLISLIACMMAQIPISVAMGLDMTNPTYWGAINLQIISSLVIFGGAILLSTIPMYGKFSRIQGNRRISILTIIVAITTILIAGYLTEWGAYFNKIVIDYFGMQSSTQTQQTIIELESLLIDMSTPQGITMSILVVGILPAILEEAYFRGLLQKGMSKVINYRNTHLPILLTATLFSLIHGDMTMFVPRLILGIVLGTIYARTHNLWACIIAHAANNIGVLIAIALSGMTTMEFLQNQKIENPGPIAPILSLFLVVFLLSYIRMTCLNTPIEKIFERIKYLIEKKYGDE